MESSSNVKDPHQENQPEREDEAVSPRVAPHLTALFQKPDLFNNPTTETSKLLESESTQDGVSSLTEIFETHPDSYTIPTIGAETKIADRGEPRSRANLKNCASETFQPATLIGSCVFVLYHVVFCMAQASTITRPYSGIRIIGPMAKTAALGILFGSPAFIYLLGDRVPAIYPTSDLFLAPFLADLATIVDRKLVDEGSEDDLRMFLATFTALITAGALLSGGLTVLASAVKLANMGSFLPYSVLCGFFSAIGVLMYTLAFSVDTGEKISAVITSWDIHLVLSTLLHHLPSVTIGIVMHVVGPHNPFYVLFLVIITIIGSYLLMLVTGTTLAEAQASNWFWSVDDLSGSQGNSSSFGFQRWAPPAPFGLVNSLWNGRVNWRAFQAGLPTIIALSFLYVIRSSLHSAALKKNIPNLTRKRPDPTEVKHEKQTSDRGTCTEKIQITLQEIMTGYGVSQIVSAVPGGLTVMPAVGAAMTLFQLGAEKQAPQYGSVLLLAFFYVTDFKMVSYIPKPSFSCLLILSCFDLLKTWFISSFKKTKRKAEWAVCPVIVVLTFSLGMLNAILVGVGISTFLFVASFHRTGVVKFVANGLTMRSTIERNVRDSNWLDQNGDLIQICVLQGYIFFGNAQSLLSYVTTMFDDPDEQAFLRLNIPLPPQPKYILLDFTMVADVDTSAIDLINETCVMCTNYNCKLILSGLEPSIKNSLLHSGVKKVPGTTFAADLDTSLGKAEDYVLKKVCHVEEQDQQDAGLRRRARALSNAEDGFRFALQKIDELHDVKFSHDLAGLQKYTKVVELQAEEELFKDDVERGFFFIEFGLLRVQQDTSFTRSIGAPSRFVSSESSLGHLNARNQKRGLEGARLKSIAGSKREQAHVFRLARIGQGWVVGTIEGLSGMRNPGVHVAVTTCRLHLLPYESVRKLEKEKPELILKLLKMVSHLGSRRQEKAIEQLSNFFRMLNSPAPTANGGIDRVAQAASQSSPA